MMTIGNVTPPSPWGVFESKTKLSELLRSSKTPEEHTELFKRYLNDNQLKSQVDAKVLKQIIARRNVYLDEIDSDHLNDLAIANQQLIQYQNELIMGWSRQGSDHEIPYVPYLWFLAKNSKVIPLLMHENLESLFDIILESGSEELLNLFLSNASLDKSLIAQKFAEVYARHENRVLGGRFKQPFFELLCTHMNSYIKDAKEFATWVVVDPLLI